MKIKPFFRDLTLTFFTEIIVLLSFFLVYRVVADIYGPQGVGEYSLIKRVAGLIQPLLLLGLGVGIPRYVAATREKEQKNSYFIAGASVVCIFTLIFLAGVNFFNAGFSNLFFGSSGYGSIVFSFSLFLGGMVAHSLVYSYFRGNLAVRRFNAIQITNLAIIPLIILLLMNGTDIATFIRTSGVVVLLSASIFLLPFAGSLISSFRKETIVVSAKEIFRYSIPRCAGDFLYAGLLSLGPIFVAHAASVKDVGFFTLAQSLLLALGALIGPLGLILLPKVSSLLADNQKETIRVNINLFIGALIQCSAFLCFQLIIFSDLIIKFWLGDAFIDAVPILRIIFLSTMFYCFYSATVSILNASKVKPLDMINVFISLVFFILLSGLLLFVLEFASPVVELSIAFTMSIIMLGLLEYISIRSLYCQSIKKDLFYLAVALMINLIFGAMAVSAKFIVASSLLYWIGLEIFLGVFYLAVLWCLKIDWIRVAAKNVTV